VVVNIVTMVEDQEFVLTQKVGVLLAVYVRIMALIVLEIIVICHPLHVGKLVPLMQIVGETNFATLIPVVLATVIIVSIIVR